MEQLGPEVLLAFALVGLAVIILMWAVARKLRRADAGAVRSEQAPPQATTPAREPSYTEIAAAAGGPRPSAPECTRKRIDYSDAATGIGPGASYMAIAITEAARAARNLPPLATTANDNAPAAPRSNGDSQSYAAIAIATVGEFTPKRTITNSRPRIDYASAAAEAAGASYAAIAVASAARNS